MKQLAALTLLTTTLLAAERGATRLAYPDVPRFVSGSNSLALVSLPYTKAIAHWDPTTNAVTEVVLTNNKHEPGATNVVFRAAVFDPPTILLRLRARRAIHRLWARSTNEFGCSDWVPGPLILKP